MERGCRDEIRGKEAVIKRGGELRASSTEEQLSISGEQLGISGGLSEYQGSRHERTIFPTQLPLQVPEKLNQYSHLAPPEHSEDLSIHCESHKLQTRPNDAELDEETRGSLPTRALDRGGDACEDSAMGLMSANLLPDDVVSIIGEIPFWKARSTIVNQQRLFTAQVFELHRLIKVQKLLAESPDILFEEGAYLGNPLKASAQKKVRLCNDVEPISDIDKHEVVHEKTDKRILSLETAVKKTPISSSQIDNMMSTYKEPRSGEIGLLCGPRLPNLMTRNYLDHSLNVVHVSMENTSSHTTQTTSSTPSTSFPPSGWPVIPLMPPSSNSMYEVDYYHKCYQTFSNMLNQNSKFSEEAMKFSPFKNEIRMASTCSLVHLGVEQHGLSISQTSPSITGCTSNQPVQHFKVLPHNARSATQQDELDTSFNSSDDDYDSEDLSISTDKSPSSPAHDEVCDNETRVIVPPIPPASDSKNKTDDLCNYQSICNVLNQNSGLAADFTFTQSKDIVVHASMASTSIQAAQISSSTPIHTREVEQPVVSIFQASPANNLGIPKQPSQDFKLLPGNARSATQSLPQTFHPSQNTSKGKQHD